MSDDTTVEPSIATLETLVKIASRLPAKSTNDAVERCGWTIQRVKLHLKKFRRICGSDFLIEDGESGQIVLGRDAIQFVEYAEAVLAGHRPIRTWPPTHEIVIGATHRTAMAYLPQFLVAFLSAVDSKGQRSPQIAVREGDSLSTFWGRLQTGQSDFGLRGLPVDEQGEPKVKPLSGINYLPISAVYKPYALSRVNQRSPGSISELFQEGRVGLLSINVDDVVARLREADPGFVIPHSGLIVCDSYMALLSFVDAGACTGLVFMPPGFAVKRPLYQREMTDLGWASRSFVFVSKRTVRRVAADPPEGAMWRREHYLAALEKVLRDPAIQKLAMEPEYRNLPVM